MQCRRPGADVERNAGGWMDGKNMMVITGQGTTEATQTLVQWAAEHSAI
jgi:hypothetical protein